MQSSKDFRHPPSPRDCPSHKFARQQLRNGPIIRKPTAFCALGTAEFFPPTPRRAPGNRPNKESWLRTRMNNIEYYWIIFTDFRFFGNFLSCFRKIDWKATDVTRFWNLARNPEKNHQKFAEKNAKFDEENEKIGNSIFQSRKHFGDF